MGSLQSLLGLDSSAVRCVIGLKNNEPQYHSVQLKKMLYDGPAKGDAKVFVICISGDYRSGKSFLMNLLVLYMAYYSEYGHDDGWVENEDIPIKGGVWAPGETAVTKGIWMFMFPKLINGKAIVLMDCQGSKDTMYSSPTLDNLILFLGLQLSDVHILNVVGTIKATDYDRLGLCVYHADDDTSDESAEQLFERHIFLVRDWGNPNKPMDIEKVIRNTQSDTMKKAALGITQAFRFVENEALPFPGENVIGQSVSANITLGDVSLKFKQQARALFHKLTIELPESATKNRDDFLTHFEFVSKRSVGKISTPQEAHEESLVKAVFNKSNAYFKEQMAKLEDQKRELTEEQMKEKVTAAYKEAEQRFTSNKRVQQCENQQVASDYLGYLKSAYKEWLHILGKTCVVEKLTKEVKEGKKKEDDREKKIKLLEVELKRKKEKVRELEKKSQETNKPKDVVLVNEAKAKVDEENRRIEEENERKKIESAKLQALEQKKNREVRDLKERIENPPIGDAAWALGKSIVNSVWGYFSGWWQ